MFLRATRTVPSQVGIYIALCKMVSLIQKKSVEAAFFLAIPWFAKASYFIGCWVSFICYGDSIVRRFYWRILLAGITHEAILFYFPPTLKEERRLLDLQPDGVLKAYS